MRLEGLRCEIDERVLLDGVSLTLVAGEPLALLGPSGSGKSLLLRCLLGLAPASASVRGTLLWGDARIDLGDRRALAGLRGRGLTLVPQAAAASLDPLRRVGAQLREVMQLHDASTRERPEDRLAEVGLPASHVDRYPRELSGGQAQRVALALALACRPAVLLADEPTASLDCIAQAELLDLLSSRCGDRRIALVLVSHDIALVARRCSRALVLAQGRVAEEGSLDTLLSTPAAPITRALVAAARRSGALAT